MVSGTVVGPNLRPQKEAGLWGFDLTRGCGWDVFSIDTPSFGSDKNEVISWAGGLDTS